MKRLLAVVVGFASVLAPASAIAQDSCGESYMVLPNGRCLNLTYATILANGRSHKASSDQRYQKVFDANVVLEVNRDITNETKEERQERLQTLAEYKKLNTEVNASTQQVEDLLYPVHQKAMGAVYRGFRR